MLKLQSVGMKVLIKLESRCKILSELQEETYSSPISLTQQFKFCGNAFRVDLYKGCDFGCKYCFANSNTSKGHNTGFGLAQFSQIERYFKRAFDDNELNTKSLTVELLQHRVPLHCGGMSDPFQKKEFEYGYIKKLIELSNKYNYPIMFSTKTAHLPKEYLDILNPNIHAFQSSIMGWTPDFIRKYEGNTPTAQDRLNFVSLLRERGFWCSIRIQPVVNLSEALLLVDNAKSIPSYYTVEHLKIPRDNIKVQKLFKSEYANFKWVYSKNNFRNIEIVTYIKKNNIDVIKSHANAFGVKVGVGDNDLHFLSQSNCCCGIDTIGDSFNNYLKYNSTYFSTAQNVDIDNLWFPKCNCRNIFYSSSLANKDKYVNFNEEVHTYMTKYPELLPTNKYDEISRITGIKFKKKLF